MMRRAAAERLYRSPRWQAVSRAAKEAAGWRCGECSRAGKLETHHVRPVREGGEPFPPPSGLVVLCRGCHQKRHRPPVAAEVVRWREFARAAPRG